MKKLKWILLSILLGLTLIVIFADVHPSFQSDVPADAGILQQTGTWDFFSFDDTSKDYSVCTFEIPDYMNSKAGMIYLKSVWKNYSLSVDGETLYVHSDKMDDGFTHLLNLPESLGHTITVKFFGIRPRYRKDMEDLQLYIGTANDISLFLLRKNMYAILFACATLLLVLVAFVSAFLLHKVLPDETFKSMIWLGIYILTANIWVLTDSSLLLLVTGNTSIVNLVSFLAFFFMPFSMLEFTSRMMPGKNRLFWMLEDLNLLLLFFYLLNRLFMLVPNVILLLAIHLLIIVTMVLSLWHGFQEIRREKNPKLLRILFGYTGLFLFTSISLFLFYRSNNLQYSQVYIIGMSCYIFFLADSIGFSVYHLIREHANMDVYARLAYLDLMTNLANRTAFIHDQENDRNFDGSLGYIMIDANGLKQVNDTFGHEKGDEFITQIAECIRTVFERHGTCYRIGGDEFVVRIKKTTRQTIEALLDDLSKEFEKRNVSRQIKLSAAVGYAFSEAPVSDLEQLLRQADDAMYNNKAKIKSACQSSSRSSN